MWWVTGDQDVKGVPDLKDVMIWKQKKTPVVPRVLEDGEI
jgi:hypothetical protein